MKRIAYLSQRDLNLYQFRLSWMKYFLAQGHSVTAIVPQGPLCEALSKEGIRVLNYSMKRGGFYFWDDLKTVISLYKIFRREKFDLLHCFILKPVFLGTLAARLAGLRIVLAHITGLGYLYIEQTWKIRILRALHRAVSFFGIKLCNHVIFQNEDDQKIFQSRFTAAQISVIHGSGIDTDFFSPKECRPELRKSVRNSLGIDEHKIVICCLARFIKHKGLREFLTVASKMEKSFPNVVFVIAGEEDSGNPSGSAEVLGNLSGSNLRVIPWQNDVRGFLYSSDIYLFLSYREGLPMSVLEAMAMEKPIVINDVPGCRQTIENGKQGFLVHANNPAEIIDRLKILIEDPALRTNTGKAARQRAVQMFSKDKIIPQIETIYERYW